MEAPWLLPWFCLFNFVSNSPDIPFCLHNVSNQSPAATPYLTCTQRVKALKYIFNFYAELNLNCTEICSLIIVDAVQLICCAVSWSAITLLILSLKEAPNQQTISPYVWMTWFSRNKMTFQNTGRWLQNDEWETNSCCAVMTPFLPLSKNCSTNSAGRSVRLNVWFPSLSKSLMSRKNANSEMNGRLNEVRGQSGSLQNTFADRPFFMFTVSVVVFI